MTYHSTMTIKGQVTVPKPIRDALGLKPGGSVEFIENEGGEMTIRAAGDPASRERRIAHIMSRVSEGRAAFAAHDTMPEMDADDFYAWVRGPAAEV